MKRNPPQPTNCMAQLVNSQWFGTFIMACIITNTVFLSMDKYPESAALNGNPRRKAQVAGRSLLV